MVELPRQVRDVARTQRNIVAVAQLDGVTRGARRAQIEAGRWQTVGSRAVALHNGDLTLEQRAWAALLCCPPGSALSGPTAAMLDGMHLEHLSLKDTDKVHVTVPRGNRLPPGECVHWSSFLTEADVHPLRQPRRTRIARSIVDAASWQRRERSVRAVVLSGVQQRLTTPQQLTDALSRRANCRHRALIRESIADARGGVASVPESDFNQIVRDWQLPAPSRQVVRLRPGGRAYLDLHWDEYDLSGKIEGVHHFDPEQREFDLDRFDELVVLGEHVLLFSSYAVRHRKDTVASIVSRVLIARGWVGQI